MAEPGAPDIPPGLCATCRHAAVITSARGSSFVRCGRSAVDPGFPRYPQLPVIACAGFVSQSAEVPMQVRHKLFASSFKSWEALCDEAASFATLLGRDRLINISTTQAETGGKGVVFVWYWE